MLLHNLVSLRRAKGYWQYEVAEKVGISRVYYNNIERGKLVPSLKTAELIARQLNVTLDESGGIRDLIPQADSLSVDIIAKFADAVGVEFDTKKLFRKVEW